MDHCSQCGFEILDDNFRVNITSRDRKGAPSSTSFSILCSWECSSRYILGRLDPTYDADEPGEEAVKKKRQRPSEVKHVVADEEFL